MFYCSVFIYCYYIEAARIIDIPVFYTEIHSCMTYLLLFVKINSLQRVAEF